MLGSYNCYHQKDKMKLDAWFINVTLCVLRVCTQAHLWGCRESGEAGDGWMIPISGPLGLNALPGVLLGKLNDKENSSMVPWYTYVQEYQSSIIYI